MKLKNSIYKLTVAALLCAIGIIIPMFSPLKIVLEPASFTLASHVAIFIAMFISPSTAAFVAIGTTIGFFFGGFPIVIVARAASHLIFAIIGSIIIYKKADILASVKSSFLFALIIALIHASCEVITVIPFYFSSNLLQKYQQYGFVKSVLLLVGVGTVVHSMVDFYIAYFIWKPIKKAALKKS